MNMTLEPPAASAAVLDHLQLCPDALLRDVERAVTTYCSDAFELFGRCIQTSGHFEEARLAELQEACQRLHAKLQSRVAEGFQRELGPRLRGGPLAVPPGLVALTPADLALRVATPEDEAAADAALAAAHAALAAARERTRQHQEEAKQLRAQLQLRGTVEELGTAAAAAGKENVAALAGEVAGLALALRPALRDANVLLARCNNSNVLDKSGAPGGVAKASASGNAEAQIEAALGEQRRRWGQLSTSELQACRELLTGGS